MMNVARLDVFCQVGFLGSNIGHSGHFALVRKIGPATAGGWEERQPRCSKSQDEHHFTMMIGGLITGTWKPYHRFQTVFFTLKDLKVSKIGLHSACSSTTDSWLCHCCILIVPRGLTLATLVTLDVT